MKVPYQNLHPHPLLAPFLPLPHNLHHPRPPLLQHPHLVLSFLPQRNPRHPLLHLIQVQLFFLYSE